MKCIESTGQLCRLKKRYELAGWSYNISN